MTNLSILTESPPLFSTQQCLSLCIIFLNSVHPTLYLSALPLTVRWFIHPSVLYYFLLSVTLLLSAWQALSITYDKCPQRHPHSPGAQLIICQVTSRLFLWLPQLASLLLSFLLLSLCFFLSFLDKSHLFCQEATHTHRWTEVRAENNPLLSLSISASISDWVGIKVFVCIDI